MHGATHGGLVMAHKYEMQRKVMVVARHFSMGDVKVTDAGRY